MGGASGGRGPVPGRLWVLQHCRHADVHSVCEGQGDVQGDRRQPREAEGAAPAGHVRKWREREREGRGCLSALSFFDGWLWGLCGSGEMRVPVHVRPFWALLSLYVCPFPHRSMAASAPQPMSFAAPSAMPAFSGARHYMAAPAAFGSLSPSLCGFAPLSVYWMTQGDTGKTLPG